VNYVGGTAGENDRWRKSMISDGEFLGVIKEG